MPRIVQATWSFLGSVFPSCPSLNSGKFRQIPEIGNALSARLGFVTNQAICPRLWTENICISLVSEKQWKILPRAIEPMLILDPESQQPRPRQFENGAIRISTASSVLICVFSETKNQLRRRALLWS